MDDIGWNKPEHWALEPIEVPITSGEIICLICERDDGMSMWKVKRSFGFYKCAVTGKTIWPFQKMASGVIAIKPHRLREVSLNHHDGAIMMVRMHEEQYIIEKLKGNV
jgi:hypothetical protein